MTKTVEQQAIEFVKKVANRGYGTIINVVVDDAQAIVDQICDHAKVKENQYCHLCGWKNFETNATAKKCYKCAGRGVIPNE